MMKNNDFSEKLDMLIKLVAKGQIIEMKRAEAVEHLQSTGLDNKTIAQLLGTSQASIRAVKSEILKRQRRKKTITKNTGDKSNE